LVTRFGHDGLASAPYYRDDSGLSHIAFGGNGEVLALTLGGNMGAWGVTVNAFGPDGAPVPSFRRNFAAALDGAAPPTFVADLIARPKGFLLIGTGQAVPVTDGSSPTATGEAIAFQLNGLLDTRFADHGELRFRSLMEGPVWALPGQEGGAVMVAEALGLRSAPMYLDLVGVSREGRAEAKLWHRPKRLPLPFRGGSWPASALPLTVATNGSLIAVVSSNASGKALELVQVRG
jgi:hypothetical protein